MQKSSNSHLYRNSCIVVACTCKGLHAAGLCNAAVTYCTLIRWLCTIAPNAHKNRRILKINSRKSCLGIRSLRRLSAASVIDPRRRRAPTIGVRSMWQCGWAGPARPPEPTAALTGVIAAVEHRWDCVTFHTPAPGATAAACRVLQFLIGQWASRHKQRRTTHWTF